MDVPEDRFGTFEDSGWIHAPRKSTKLDFVQTKSALL